MKLLNLNCNRCGASIRVPDSAHFISCTGCHASLKVEQADGAVFTRVLSVEESAGKLDPTQAQLNVVLIEREMERLEAGWHATRERFVTMDKMGNKYYPGDYGEEFLPNPLVLITLAILFGLTATVLLFNKLEIPAAIVGMLAMVSLSLFVKKLDLWEPNDNSYASLQLRYKKKHKKLAMKLQEAKQQLKESKS